MFSELLLKNGWSKIISFPEPDLVKIDQISIFSEFTPGYFKIGDYICVEKYLKGKYIKFTNNAGYTTRDETM
jgi:hypothetical protein